MEPKTLRCIDCDKDFEFSVEEQQFFKEKGFTEPKRCKPCRKIRKQEKLNFGRKKRQSFQNEPEQAPAEQ